MADKDIILNQEQADGSFLEKTITPVANEVLGFDGSKDPASIAAPGGGTVQGTDGTYDIEPTAEGATPGNARGEYSVDLCTQRGNAAYVTAGVNSFNAAGQDIGGTGTHTLYSGRQNYSNTGDYCSISGQGNHSNSGTHCLIAGQYNSSNSGFYCSITGQQNSSNTGYYTSISGWSNTSNTGSYCLISGLYNSSNSGDECSISGEGHSSNSGDNCSISGRYNKSNSGDYCLISGHFNQGNFGTHSNISGKVAPGSTKIATSGTTADAGTDLITKTSHGVVDGSAIKFTTLTGGTGLSTATQYYARDILTNTFAVALTRGGAAVDITVDYTVANYIANAVNYGNFNLISGEDNEGGTGSWCVIGGDQNYNNDGSYCSISGQNNYSNSGTHCSISGINNYNNTGGYCSISGNLNHSNSGTHCLISGRSNNGNTGYYSLISGYNNSSNTGYYCSISGYANNSNTGSNCLISGRNASSNALSYARVHGGKNNARIIDLVAQIDSSGVGATELLLGGSSGTRIIIPNQSAWAYEVTMVAKTATGLNASVEKFFGVIGRDSTTTTLAAGTGVAIVTTGTTNATFTVSGDDTNEALKLEVTCSSGTVRAVARIHLTQVDY